MDRCLPALWVLMALLAFAAVVNGVRQPDTLDGVAVADFNGVDALVLSEGDGYVTRIYCHNGAIMELYADETLDLSLEAGEPIMEAQPLVFSMEDGRLTVTSGAS